MSKLNNNTAQLEALLAKVNALPEAGSGGIDTSDATAVASDILLNKTAYADGVKLTGTFTIEEELTDQNDLITQIQTALQGKSAGGVTLPTLSNPASTSDILSGKEAIDEDGKKIIGTIDTKTSSNLTASGATVTVPAGYYATQVTKSVASGSATTPATAITKNPSISVNSSGLITASVSGTQNVTPTVNAGYVSSGTAGTITVSGSATKQLTTQAAKTITPSTSSQTAVASGVYTTGVITVGPIPSDYIMPSGTKEITSNGTHDVTEYASVSVSVASSGDGEDLEAVLTEQEASIEELKEILRSKASSGAELNLGTCTVIINVPSKTNYYICRESVSDGAITYNMSKSYTNAPITITSRCNSVMYIVAGTINGVEVTDGEVLRVVSGQGVTYKTPNLNNSIVQITLTA